MSVITDTTTIVKKRCKIQNETIPVTKKLKNLKNETAEIRGKAYFHAFLRFSIVSISLLRCSLVQ